MQHRLIPALTTVLVAAATLIGCGGKDSSEVTVRPIEPAATSAVQPAGASSAQRFGMTRPAPSALSAMAPAGAFTAETPSGWQPVQPSSARPLNYQVGRDPNAEAYFTTLSSGGGGLVANVNRWRTQMSLPELTEDEVAALPKKPLLGHDAVYVNLDGTFSSMGSEPKQNYKLLGLIALDGDTAYFAKMTGPAPILEGQEDQFLAWAASIKEGTDPHAGLSGDPHAAADPHAGISGMDMGTDLTAWRWQAPDTWNKAPDRPMRLVTYTSGPENQNEVYIAELGGPAGGVDMNINRWRQQMGQPPLSPDEIAALPTVPVMGQDAPIVEIEGDFTDDMRGLNIDTALMYGAIVPVGDRTLFVKMVGPKDAMAAEKDNFLNFTRSITQAE